MDLPVQVPTDAKVETLLELVGSLMACPPSLLLRLSLHGRPLYDSLGLDDIGVLPDPRLDCQPRLVGGTGEQDPFDAMGSCHLEVWGGEEGSGDANPGLSFLMFHCFMRFSEGHSCSSSDKRICSLVIQSYDFFEDDRAAETPYL